MSILEEIQSYKKLLDDGVIEPDEYAKMKEAAFNKNYINNNGIDVIRELKELLDTDAITEVEYNAQKSKVISNEFKDKGKSKNESSKLTTQAANINVKKLLSGKKKIAIIAAVGVLILIVLIATLGGGNGKALPGGVHFGDSYNKVMKAAKALDPEAEESEYGGIWLHANLYGYDCSIDYDVSESEPLSKVTVMPSDSYDKNVLVNVVEELTKEYGKPSSSGTVDFAEDEADEVVWKFKNLEIEAFYYDDVMITFKKPE